MKNIQLHGGITAVNVDDKTAEILKGREAFIEQYCKTKGWSRDNLSIEQILEIRKEEGWKHPVSPKADGTKA